jgi:hypothetical protein
MMLNKRISNGIKEYQWADMKDTPMSDWMNFDEALIWIQEYDRNKDKKMVLE